MLEDILEQINGWKKVSLPEDEVEIVCQYTDIIIDKGIDSREAKNYFKAVRKLYPKTLPILEKAKYLKKMFEAGYIK